MPAVIVYSYRQSYTCPRRWLMFAWRSASWEPLPALSRTLPSGAIRWRSGPEALRIWRPSGRMPADAMSALWAAEKGVMGYVVMEDQTRGKAGEETDR